jgi:hypothetical protein
VNSKLYAINNFIRDASFCLSTNAQDFSPIFPFPSFFDITAKSKSIPSLTSWRREKLVFSVLDSAIVSAISLNIVLTNYLTSIVF